MGGLVILPESLPLGFRFRPTDEELVNHYLKRKINGRIKSDVVVIPEVDVCKCEPWDLPDKSVIRSEDPEWFFFGPKDRKYPNGHRSNRATEAGYWKATGKDRTVRTRPPSAIPIGMKKTLVFHRGRAPKGERTNWIMHEYRTTESEFEQGAFVLYRLFRKPDEKIPVSNAEEIEFSDFSLVKTKSSNDIAGEDYFEELSAMLNQEIVDHTHDNVTKTIQKSTATNCDSCITPYMGAREYDIGNMKVDPILGPFYNSSPGFEQGDSDEFHYNSPTDYYLSYLSFDDSGGGVSSKDEDGDRESISEFLDAILFNSEGGAPDKSRILANSTVVSDAQLCDIKHESPLECISGTDSVIGDNVDIEAFLLQKDPCLEPSCKFEGSPYPASFYLQHLPDSCSNARAQFDDNLMGNVIFSHANEHATYEFSTTESFQGIGLFESSDESNNLFGGSSQHATSEDLLKNEESLGSVDSSMGTGIKLRVRANAHHTPSLANTSNVGYKGMAGQGLAMRRFRLQKSIRAGAPAITDDKSSNIEDSRDGKSEIPEAGENGKLSNSEQNSFPVRAVNVASFGSSDDDYTASSMEVKQSSSNSLGSRIKEVNPPTVGSTYFGRGMVVVSTLLLVLCIGIVWITKYLTSKNDIHQIF